MGKATQEQEDGRIGKADRVLSRSATEPVPVSVHSGGAPLRLARVMGAREVDTIARRVDANSLERESIHRLEELVRHGYKFIDITVRKDGREQTFEGDWLARLLRPTQADWERAWAAFTRSDEV